MSEKWNCWQDGLAAKRPGRPAPRPGELPSGGLPGETKGNSSSSCSQASFQLLARFKLFPGSYNLYVFSFFLGHKRSNSPEEALSCKSKRSLKSFRGRTGDYRLRRVISPNTAKGLWWIVMCDIQGERHRVKHQTLFCLWQRRIIETVLYHTYNTVLNSMKRN